MLWEQIVFLRHELVCFVVVWFNTQLVDNKPFGFLPSHKERIQQIFLKVFGVLVNVLLWRDTMATLL